MESNKIYLFKKIDKVIAFDPLQWPQRTDTCACTSKSSNRTVDNGLTTMCPKSKLKEYVRK